MSQIRMQIDGKAVEADEGMTVLEVARRTGISIPTLCHHQDLKPHGGCRLCVVEAESAGGTKLVASCVHQAQDNLVIRTRSAKVDRIRKTLLELLLAHAPESPQLQRLADEYGAVTRRFEQQASFCVHCGLCVRYCAEVKKLNAVGFVERGTKRMISFVPQIASRECSACKECFPLCPSSYVQAAFVLVSALTSPSQAREAKPAP